MLPTQQELKSIVESGEAAELKSVQVHLQETPQFALTLTDYLDGIWRILGNTGSGKSCSVAGVIRWSIEAARRSMPCPDCGQSQTNSRFIILDPNGRYSQAFKDLDNVRVFAVEADEENDVKQLKFRYGFGTAPNGVHLHKRVVAHNALS